VSAASDKPFEATPSRRARARRDGNVARSAEAGSVAAFAAALAAATFAVPLAASAAGATLHFGTLHPREMDPFALAVLGGAALAPAAAAAVAGSGVALAQSGGLHLAPLRFEAARLQPFAGLRRMLGGEAAVGVVRATLAFGLATAAIVPFGYAVIGAGVAPASPLAAAALAGGAALRACLAAVAVGATFAVFDYALARRRWLRGLRMSLDELKRDAKENEGDPQARSRRKSAHRALVRGSIGRVREATLVVVNPEHVAVGLRYAPPAVAVPEIVVRALGDVALRVKALARERSIPIVEDAALARLLYGQGESGRPIPREAYVAVAQIVAELARADAL
jgi:flagellar biosynthesis protein FlhB